MKSNKKNTESSSTTAPVATVPKIYYHDLLRFRENDNDKSSSPLQEKLTAIIANAYGPSGYGILAVDFSVPPSDVKTEENGNDVAFTSKQALAEYEILRSTLLPMAKSIASLPPDDLTPLEQPEMQYQIGWSHGREALADGIPDVGKGSYYANPLVDACALPKGWTEEDVSQGGFESVFAANVWPTKQGKLENLERAFMGMGKFVQRVGIDVAKICDVYVSQQCPGFNRRKLETVVSESRNCKGRLLHYFSPSPPTNVTAAATSNDDDDGIANADPFSTWCGWHNDHGSLTGLVPAMYLTSNGEVISKPPDPNAGLYVKSRTGTVYKVQLPPNALAFQIGETAQIHTGGILQATPHAVRGVAASPSENGCEVTREAFAVFMEPEVDGEMDIPKGKTVEDAQSAEAERFLPNSVKSLKSRWLPGMTFGEFHNATISAFHG